MPKNRPYPNESKQEFLRRLARQAARGSKLRRKAKSRKKDDKVPRSQMEIAMLRSKMMEGKGTKKYGKGVLEAARKILELGKRTGKLTKKARRVLR